jgi:hypothetical protein
MNESDEFYIGWEDRAPQGIRLRVRWVVVSFLALSLTLSVVMVLAQRTIGESVFEWGRVRSFSGIFKSQPYPHLLVPRPGSNTGQGSYSSYYLVNPFKFGVDPMIASEYDGQKVTLNGTLIYRGDQKMIEVVANSLRRMEPTAEVPSWPQMDSPVNLGQQTLIGEIVDSKCFLGVMNPGALIPHRGCAIRCISGGIPPVFLIRQSNGSALYLLLVSRDGKSVNKDVLGFVAEPIEIVGDVERQGDLLILRADPQSYRRLKP